MDQGANGHGTWAKAGHCMACCSSIEFSRSRKSHVLSPMAVGTSVTEERAEQGHGSNDEETAEVIVILPSRFVRQSRECKETTKHKHGHGQRHRHRHRHRHEMAAHEEDLLEPTVVGVDSRTAGRWLASAASVAMASHLTRVVLAYLTSLEDNSDREDAASTQLMGLQSCRRDLPIRACEWLLRARWLMNRTRCWFHLPPFTRSLRKSRRRNSHRFTKQPTSGLIGTAGILQKLPPRPSRLADGRLRVSTHAAHCDWSRLPPGSSQPLLCRPLRKVCRRPGSGLVATALACAPSPGRVAAHAACSPPNRLHPVVSHPPCLACQRRRATFIARPLFRRSITIKALSTS